MLYLIITLGILLLFYLSYYRIGTVNNSMQTKNFIPQKKRGRKVRKGVLENAKFQIVAEKRTRKEEQQQTDKVETKAESKSESRKRESYKDNYISNQYVSNRIRLALDRYERNGDKTIFLQLFVRWYHLYPYLKDYFNEIGYSFKYNANQDKLFVERTPDKKYISYINYLKRSRKEGFGLHGIKVDKRH